MIKFKVLRPFFSEKETIWRIIACHLVGAALLLIGLTNWRPTIASPLPVQLDRQSILPFTSAAPKWHFQCVDCSVDAFYLGDRALALDSNGMPHVAYVGDAIYYAWFDGIQWNRESLAVAPSEPAPAYGPQRAPPALALDADDMAHIAYLNADNTAVIYARKTPTGWDRQVVETAIPGKKILYEVAITLDAGGNPHLSYSNWGFLKYAHWTGNQWQVETVDTTGWVEMYISMELDSAGTPHIGYFLYNFFDGTHDGTQMMYARRTAGGWTREVIDSAKWVGEYNSLALDGNDHPHLSYMDVTYSKIKYAYWNGSTWMIEEIDDSEWWGGFTSIVVDKAGNPHISYTTNHTQARYASRIGSTWDIHIIENPVLYTSLALDEDEQPHMIYFSWNNRGLIHTHWTGTEWDRQITDRTGSVGLYTALALDRGGNPHISYTDYSYNDYSKNKLKYADYENGRWELQTIDAIGDTGGYTDLALNSASTPYISYYDGINGDLKYAYWDASTWITATVDSAGNVGAYTSLALDQTGKSHISYYDGTRGDLKYAHQTGNAWITATVDNAGDVGAYTSLALDQAGNPHISYYDGTRGDLKYAHWTGNVWITATVDSAGNVGTHTSLALDQTGNPHVSYYDSTHGDLKYAYWTGHVWAITTVDNTDDVGSFSSLALDSNGNPHISYYRNTHGGLKYAYWAENQWVIQSIKPAWNVGTYTSLVLDDATDQPHISYHDGDYRDLAYAKAWNVSLTMKVYLPLIQRNVP